MKAKQHRLSADAQTVVAVVATETGWSESRSAAWLIQSARIAMKDRIMAAHLNTELMAACELHKVRLANTKRERQAQMNLRQVRVSKK